MRTAAATDWMYGAPERRRHTFAAMLALVLSLLIHGFALVRLPPLQFLPVGPEWDAPPAVQTPFRVEEVRTEPPAPSPAEPPAALLSPERVREVFRPAPPRVEDRSLEPVLAALPEPAVSLVGEQEALAQPAPLPEQALREPRLRQVEVTREVVPDLRAARPRRITPRIERSLDAPDITLPTDPALPAGWSSLLHDAVLDPAGTSLSAAPSRAAGSTGGLPGPRGGNLAGAVSDGVLRGMEPPKVVESVDRYLAFHVRAHRPMDEPDTVYYRIEVRRAGPEALPVLPRDVLLVVDASESMTQPLIDQCKQGLRALVQTLAPEDRFDIVAFRETQDVCFGEWTPATATSRARAQWFIEQLESRGRTDVHASLEGLLERPVSPGRPVIAVFVTDGIPTTGVLDQSTILERFTRSNAGRISIFPFGAGPRVNRFLLDFIGFKNRGDAFFVESFPAVPTGVQRMAQEIRRPVLTDLAYQVSGTAQEEIYPRTLTHLYLDRPLILFGRARTTVDAVGLRITGRAGPRLHDIIHRIDAASVETGGIEIRDAWALQKAYHLIGEHAATGDPAALEQLRSLTRRTGIRTPYADALEPPGSAGR